MSIQEHADYILDRLCRMEGEDDYRAGRIVHSNIALARRYATVAAKWSLIRLRLHRNEAGEAEKRQFEAMTELLRKLTAELGLRTWSEGEDVWRRIGMRDIPDPKPVAGVTNGGGYVPGDIASLLNETWDESVAVWHGMADWQKSGGERK